MYGLAIFMVVPLRPVIFAHLSFNLIQIRCSKKKKQTNINIGYIVHAWQINNKCLELKSEVDALVIIHWSSIHPWQINNKMFIHAWQINNKCWYIGYTIHAWWHSWCISEQKYFYDLITFWFWFHNKINHTSWKIRMNMIRWKLK